MGTYNLNVTEPSFSLGPPSPDFILQEDRKTQVCEVLNISYTTGTHTLRSRIHHPQRSAPRLFTNALLLPNPPSPGTLPPSAPS